MEREKIKICILRVGGTNRDRDAASCFQALGVRPDIVRLNDILRMRNLAYYSGLVIPGGFAYGDYVRAGAILGKRILANLKEDIRRFTTERKPIIGICNGFQVLVEAGMLPGLDLLSDTPEVALGPNKSGHFECRWVSMLPNANSPCIFLKGLKSIVQFPVAHGEGRFMASSKVIKDLKNRNQIALQYATKEGRLAKGKYPFNPNGSISDIAGICNPSGTVFGLMPHPENAFKSRQMPDWKKDQTENSRGDGYPLFESMVRYIEEKFS